MKLLFIILILLSGISNSFTQNSSNCVISLEEQTRFNKSFVYEHIDTQLKYSLSKVFDVFADYRFIFQNKNNKEQEQNVFIIGNNLKTPLSICGQLVLRSRIEIKTQSQLPTAYIQAEYLKYYFPISLTKYKITPFIGDEIGCDYLNGFNMARNRAYVGIDYKITKNIKGSACYFIESNKKNNRWSNANIGEFSLRYEFK
jgi:hypothetical protein